MSATPITHDKTFLGRTPVLWANMIRAVLYALVLFGFNLSDGQLAGVMVAVEALLAWLVGANATPNVSVVERTDVATARVIAGPANEKVIPGTVVRDHF